MIATSCATDDALPPDGSGKDPRGRRFAKSAVRTSVFWILLVLLIEIVVRPWSGYGLPGSQVFVRQLTMWVALLGAALAARDGTARLCVAAGRR